MSALVIYVDIDDTLIRSVGSKRILMSAVVRSVKDLAASGAELYAWSSGGSEYAKESARELGVEALFRAFLPKPQVMVDDQAPSEWRRLVHVPPSEMSGRGVADLEQAYERGAG